jgi:hypothetical protein
MKVAINAVVIPQGRIRENPEEDFNELVDSIIQVGQLQPVLVLKQEEGGYRLVAGERRLRAMAYLAESLPDRYDGTVDVKVATPADDPLWPLKAEIAENLSRRGWTPWEKVVAARQLMDGERELAQMRTKAGVRAVAGEKGRATERVAQALGWSHTTLEHALDVAEAVEGDPEQYGDLGEGLHNGSPIDPLYHEMKRRETYRGAPAPQHQPTIDVEPAYQSIPAWVSSHLKVVLSQLASGEEPEDADWPFSINGNHYHVMLMVREEN